MMKSGSLAYNGIKSVQFAEAVLLIAGSVLLQFAVHLIPPVGGIPLGQILLPAFIIPLAAVIFFRLSTGLIVAIAAPVVNYFITGAPRPEILTMLTIEVAIFTVGAWLLLRSDKMKYAAAIIAFVSVKVITGLFTGFALSSYYFIIPGVMLLVFLNIVLLKKKGNNV